MGIFNPGAPFLSDLNLIIQAVIIGFFVFAMYFRLKHSFVKHALMMGAGISLHTVAIFAIMVPSLLSLRGLLKNLLTRFSLITLTHAAAGSLVEIMGIWLIVSWLTDTVHVEKCVKRKNIMRVTIALWLLEFVLGVYIYMMLYAGA
jgi:uncharacterized membrane protein YozB (DUF420 family)